MKIKKGISNFLVHRYLSYINEIRNVTMIKLEEITAALCLFAEDLAEIRAKDLEE